MAHRRQIPADIPGVEPHQALAANVVGMMRMDEGEEAFREWILGPCGAFWVEAAGLDPSLLYDISAKIGGDEVPEYELRRVCRCGGIMDQHMGYRPLDLCPRLNCGGHLVMDMAGEISCLLCGRTPEEFAREEAECCGTTSKLNVGN